MLNAAVRQHELVLKLKKVLMERVSNSTNLATFANALFHIYACVRLKSMELHAGIQSLYRFKSLVLHGTKNMLFKGVIILRGSSRDTLRAGTWHFLEMSL